MDGFLTQSGSLFKFLFALAHFLVEIVIFLGKIKKLAFIGFPDSFRTSVKPLSIFFLLLYAKPKLPTAPELETADTNLGVVMPPAIGAWKIGSPDTNPIFNCGSTDGSFQDFLLT